MATNDAAETSLATCPCAHCGQHLEFDPTRFAEGMIVNCPHCYMETALHLPSPPQLRTPSQVSTQPPQPRARRRPQYQGGLRVWAVLLFLVGLGLSGLGTLGVMAGGALEKPVFAIVGAAGLLTIVGAILASGLDSVVEAIRNK